MSWHRTFRAGIASVALAAVLAMPAVARAQRAPTWEVGQDVYSGSSPVGELAMYGGVSQHGNLIAFRLGVLDESQTVPCSLGVMYQRVGFRGSPVRIKPTASLAVGRVVSCASNSDPRKGSPSIKGTASLGAGIRVGMFEGRSIAGSLDVMGYLQRISRAAAPTSRMVKGVMVGIAIHGR